MKETLDTINEIGLAFAKMLVDNYWQPIRERVKNDKTLIDTIPDFLINPEKIVFYFNKTHLAVEYFGKIQAEEVHEEGTIQSICHDFTQKESFFEEIIGFQFDTTTKVKFPIPHFLENHIAPTNKGIDKLLELKWNFDAQEAIISINSGNFYFAENSFTRIVNSFYFDEQNGFLKTRHIKWLDCYPIHFSDIDEDYERFEFPMEVFKQQLEKDPKYLFPKVLDFKYSKLQKLNRFIELVADDSIIEADITTYLALPENEFILTMAFFATSISSQKLCEWQSEEKTPLKPDFFITQPNGYANILEFKLPILKSRSVTGMSNRETFSAELNSYISQVRVYKKYFEDPNNRVWMQQEHNLKIESPKKILVIGRRWNFENTEWKEIVADYKDLEIFTYDDIIDGILAQLYKK